jgi:hypothetical protein
MSPVSNVSRWRKFRNPETIEKPLFRRNTFSNSTLSYLISNIQSAFCNFEISAKVSEILHRPYGDQCHIHRWSCNGRSWRKRHDFAFSRTAATANSRTSGSNPGRIRNDICRLHLHTYSQPCQSDTASSRFSGTHWFSRRSGFLKEDLARADFAREEYLKTRNKRV